MKLIPKTLGFTQEQIDKLERIRLDRNGPLPSAVRYWGTAKWADLVRMAVDEFITKHSTKTAAPERKRVRLGSAR